MSQLFVPPNPQDNRFDKVLSREEEVAVAMSLFGFEEIVAKRMCFQRWLRRYRTHEGWRRDPATLLYPVPRNDYD